MTGLDFVLDRTVTIAARRETVFRYFTDSERFAAWWGEGSRIEPGPAAPSTSATRTRSSPAGRSWRSSPASGSSSATASRSGQPIPIGASRVTITPRGDGPAARVVELRHELPTAAGAGRARPGLALPARGLRQRGGEGGARGRRRACRPLLRLLGRDRRGQAARRARGRRHATSWPSATPTPARPGSTTSSPTSPRASASCRAWCSRGEGEARSCQGTALVDWVVKGPDGTERAKGTNVFELTHDGRIARVTGIWG